MGVERRGGTAIGYRIGIRLAKRQTFNASFGKLLATSRADIRAARRRL
jgi:hypothetical protein